MIFEWDAAKNLVNIAKHGPDFLDARQVFDGRTRLDTESPRHQEVPRSDDSHSERPVCRRDMDPTI